MAFPCHPLDLYRTVSQSLPGVPAQAAAHHTLPHVLCCIQGSVLGIGVSVAVPLNAGVGAGPPCYHPGGVSALP